VARAGKNTLLVIFDKIKNKETDKPIFKNAFKKMVVKTSFFTPPVFFIKYKISLFTIKKD